MADKKELPTDTDLFFALSEAFDEMYGYVTELYEINLGIDCEKYSEEEITEFVENTNDNAEAVYEKWNKITHRRIEKAISDNNPTPTIRRYTECAAK